jgi:cytidylate kinase
MLELQRGMGKRGAIVAEGRDIGTVVFPQADVKVFLDASLRERARRRFEELKAAGGTVEFEQTLREMAERDRRDSERDIAPLCQAEDAVRIDSSSANADEVGATVLQLVRSKTQEK